MKRNEFQSDCTSSFGHQDFDIHKCIRGFTSGCPVDGCTAPLELADDSKTISFCQKHGLRLHSNTFVYWNGPRSSFDGRLRNFAIQREAAVKTVLMPSNKVESHRLGYEMSEDALSWNVFVGLTEAGKLREAIFHLTGKTVKGEPTLYLWGQLIDLASGSTGEYAPLIEVRLRLESDIKKFKTEPDIMLIVPGELTVCIEAKFGSGNPLAHDTSVKPGDKPVRSTEIVRRYYNNAGPRTKKSISIEDIDKVFHSQLFRNVIFASEMAGDGQWHVVNLISSSQSRQVSKSLAYSYADPTNHVRAYLRPESVNNFTYRSWEGLRRDLIDSDPALYSIRDYMSSKSAHFAPAFR